MYGDELTIVYDSYSLLKTGMDQTGEKFPLTFKMGAGRPAGYVYGSIPFVAIFGPTELGVRGLSILSGLGIILLMYFLGRKLLDEKTGLLASFLTSISMWDIYLSRGGFEAHFGLFLTLLGVVLFLYKKYILMALAFGIAVFTYPTFKLTIPLLLLFLMLYSGFLNTLKNKMFFISVLILSVFAGFTIKETYRGVSENRFFNLNILTSTSVKEQMIQKINEQRTLSTLPENIKPFIYNKPLYYSRVLFENYIENLSPQFLYLRGDRNPRHNPGEWGMLYLAEIPLLFIGLFFLANNNKKELILIVSWILIVPLATMLLGQTHALRNDLMLPTFILISAFAISKSSDIFGFFCFVFIGIQFAAILSTIYYFVPNKFGSFWSSDARVASVKAINADKNEEVVLSAKIDNIEYAYPVYAKIDPKLVISQYQKWPKIYSNVIITDK